MIYEENVHSMKTKRSDTRWQHMPLLQKLLQIAFIRLFQSVIDWNEAFPHFLSFPIHATYCDNAALFMIGQFANMFTIHSLQKTDFRIPLEKYPPLNRTLNICDSHCTSSRIWCEEQFSTEILNLYFVLLTNSENLNVSILICCPLYCLQSQDTLRRNKWRNFMKWWFFKWRCFRLCVVSDALRDCVELKFINVALESCGF